ncbi:MAG: ATP-binding cassette domain-containing protein [Planctomycetaceae bacterium]|jgi:molybdate transport system ATP-binding protein|nr:ATP-binding cassette domain-containing protein [Planctomycetaceae bacterium]
MSLEVNITKKLAHFTLKVSFRTENECLGLLGASGCGKSITLKCIAGIVQPDSGFIVINGCTVFDSERKINLPPQKRRTGFLFQQYALFPTMTVRENVEIVLRHLKKTQRKQSTDEILEKLRLQEFSRQKPSQLSGGQQQRVAMARMLVSSPEIIMLDEPFSALDSFLRLAVETELAEILAAFSGTILFVSHNRDEIYRLCQRMLVLQNGTIAALGTTSELFRNPETLATARLIGIKNIAPAFPVGNRKINVPDWGIILETNQNIPDGTNYVAIRAHHIREAQPNETVNCFDFNVSRKQNEPFRIQEILTLTPESCQNNESGQNNGTSQTNKTGQTKTPLIRFISGTQDPFFSSQEVHLIRRLCIPPSHLLLLKNEQ